MFKAVTPEREIILAANDNYFKGRPHINQFAEKPFADQNIMTQALMFNAIDMIVLVNPRDIPEIQGDKRFVLKPYNALVLLVLRLQRPESAPCRQARAQGLYPGREPAGDARLVLQRPGHHHLRALRAGQLGL